MKINFWKYQGTGNDFIMLDGRDSDFRTLSSEKIEYLCHRRFGIGADGLIVLENSDSADFIMRYFNSDGKVSSMCGNGGRCITRFALDRGLVNKRYSFIAVDGPHESYIEGDQIFLKMGDVPKVYELGENNFFVDTGSPHFVSLQTSVLEGSILEAARTIRFSDPFREEGVNVNFVSSADEALNMRTYERGVEDETLSCGTGVTAAALVADKAGIGNGSGSDVNTAGGKLELHFQRDGEGYKDIWLVGPAKMVFAGKIDI